MPSELWGAAAGLQAFVQDRDQHALVQLQLEEGQTRIGLEKVQLQQAQTTLTNQNKLLSNLASMQQAWSQEKKPDAMSQADWEVQRRSQHFEQMSEEYARDGFPDQAATFANTGSEMEYRQAQIKYQKAQTDIQQWNLGLELLKNVTDDQSLRTANQKFKDMTGQPSPLEGAKYNKETIGRIRTMGMNALQLAETQQRLAQANMQNSEVKRYNAWANYEQAMADWVKVHGPSRAKVGGAAAALNLPAGAWENGILNLAGQDYVFSSQDQRAEGRAKQGALEAAEIAKGIVAEGYPGSLTDALKIGYQYEVVRGGFAGLKEQRKVPGFTPSNPLAAPYDKQGKVVDSSMKLNMWYKLVGKDGKLKPYLITQDADGNVGAITEEEMRKDANEYIQKARNSKDRIILSTPPTPPAGYVSPDQENAAAQAAIAAAKLAHPKGSAASTLDFDLSGVLPGQRDPNDVATPVP